MSGSTTVTLHLPAGGPADRAVRRLPPPRFDLATAGRSYPVAGLVFPHYRPGVTGALHPIPPVEALQRLIASETLFRRLL